ncbi:MAG TPA: GntR family transcriptional regulator [Thermomicrobiaceae bacterium]|nr:GntR family transcriptional regulator [Thermomicrobiaceae bacterium]
MTVSPEAPVGSFDRGKHSAAEVAYSRLRDLIVAGTLRPGQVLNEQEIVEQLGIGRTPVREAMQRLAAQQMLTIFPRRGIAVAKLGLADIQAIFEGREALEAQLAAFAAVRRTASDLDLVLKLGEQVKHCAETEDSYAFLKLDQQLHRTIAESARSRFMAESVAHLLLLSDWTWHQYFLLHGSHPNDYFDHTEIIQAISAREPDRAFSAMSRHIRDSRDLVRSAV